MMTDSTIQPEHEDSLSLGLLRAGLGLIGIAINSFGHSVTVATTLFGLSKTTYSAVFGKGREVSFPRDTPIQVQLAGGPHEDAARPESAR